MLQLFNLFSKTNLHNMSEGAAFKVRHRKSAELLLKSYKTAKMLVINDTRRIDTFLDINRYSIYLSFHMNKAALRYANEDIAW